MEKIHKGHQGVERCCWRARASVWWPGVTHQITQTVQHCTTCAKEARQRKEPLMSTILPDYPWQVVGTDLFKLNGIHYLITVDYFSRYPEVIKMSSTISLAVISALKAVFCRHGLPEIVRSDNGPQYSSLEFSKFAESYNFKHVTSSPLYPQSNGLAERSVQTVKKLLKNTKDPYMALLSYRSTPLPWCGWSPTELSMGRWVRTLVPQVTKLLIPNWSCLPAFQEKDKAFKQQQEKNYDVRYRVREQPDIPEDTEVWIQSESMPIRGRVSTPANTPRCIVRTPSGELRRNRNHLSTIPPIEGDPANTPSTESEETNQQVGSRIMTRSHTGTIVFPPDRYTVTPPN